MRESRDRDWADAADTCDLCGDQGAELSFVHWDEDSPGVWCCGPCERRHKEWQHELENASQLTCKMMLQLVKEAQPEWSRPKNGRAFGDPNFGDRGYRVLKGKVSGEWFLVRSAWWWREPWQAAPLIWRINPIEENLRIGPLIEDIFSNLEAARAWLRLH
jgi:hypothetical protein